MADQLILLDTSILIDYYRKSDKKNSVWVELIGKEYEFSVSAITKFEIYSGATSTQLEFWENIFQTIIVIPLDEGCVDAAVRINKGLKIKRKQIDLADLLIASTAIAYDLPFSTLNRKHFDRIEELMIIT